MSLIRFDFETRSPVPIRYGVDAYFSRARPLLLTWAADDGPVQLIDYTGTSQLFDGVLPDVFHEPGHTFIAHNCQFDRRVLERLFKLHRPIQDFRCTQAQAYSHGLPGSLETLGAVLGIQQQKLTGEDGRALMLHFCTPRSILKDGTARFNEPHEFPEKWEAFKRYAVRDVEALREVHRKLPTWNYQADNLATWHLDQRINERGIGFDVELAQAAVRLLEGAKGRQRMVTDLHTGGAVGSVTQRDKLLQWFKQSGLDIASMRASDVRDALESDDLEPQIRYMLELRLEGSKSSGAKYKKGLSCTGPDGRIRDTMLFNGATRTGRWAGRTLQPQNLSRYSPQWEELNKDNPHEPIEQIVLPAIMAADVATLQAHGGVNSCCNDAIRSCIVASPGHELVAADWSNIEGRALAWLADDPVQLAYFAAQDKGEAPDAYKHLWAQLFHVPVENVTKPQRQAAKQLVLACNYLGGVGALITMALGNGLNLEDLTTGVLDLVPADIAGRARKAYHKAFLSGEDFGLKPYTFQACHALVQTFRRARREVTEQGYELGRIVLDATRSPNTAYHALKCTIWSTGHALIIQLPCGRRLYYWQPTIKQTVETDAVTGKTVVREQFWYRAARGKNWLWQSGWPGLFVENITQAVANSVLRAGLLNIDRAYPDAVVLHVHDEPVCEAPIGTLPVEHLEHLLTDDLKSRHPWMAGLPLAASGWRGKRFRK